MRHSGITVHIPTERQPVRGDDLRDAVAPDIELDLTAADSFAGRDTVLDLALDRE